MNNAVYDNINMENVRNHVNIKLITIWEDITRRQWSWNWIFTAAEFFVENLIAVEIRKLEMKFDKPFLRGYVHTGHVESLLV